jgi:membrane protein YdbS with pleckstrin-like domain
MSRMPTHQPDRPTVYPSAVDLWVMILLMFSPVLAGGLGMYFWLEGNNRDAIVLLITAIGTLLVTMMFVAPCRYTIEENDLHVRCGIISYRIPLKTIERVEPSRTLVSGPALSLKRVVAVTKLKTYVLSPLDRDGFIADVSAASEAKRANSGEV